MKNVFLALALLVSGCTIRMEPTPEVEKALQQQAVVLNAVVNYIEQCQAKGICPKPTPEKENK